MQRKFLSLSLLALVVLLVPQLRGEEAGDDQAFFDKHVGQFVKLAPKRLTSEALPKIFSATFYNVGVSIGEDGGGTTLTVARVGDEIAQVTTPSSSAEMPAFVKLVKEDFVLKTDADAHLLQDALDVLYPIDSRFSPEDVNLKAIRHKANQFTFVRGKFFDNVKGFVVTTDAVGKITSVKYSLEESK